MLMSEFPDILPDEIIRRYAISAHDADSKDLVNLGETSRGTAILANRRFMEADYRIVVANIEPHHFMGFSGGAKSAAIGLAGRKTINQNHALLSHPLAKTGHFVDNPMRQEVEEIGQRMDIQFALNAILNNNKEIVRVLAGQPLAVIEAGVPIARSICQVRVDHLYDMVIASAGGHPKDINLYQSQKALTHAALLTRDNGIIILLAECPDGPGSSGYEKFMDGITSFDQVFKRFSQQGFAVGPHKAFLVARDASRVRIRLYSSMKPQTTNRLLLTPVTDVNQAINQALDDLAGSPRVALMPIAAITIPMLQA
jgi:nickel-dependent lactate racemase